jgi:hypothetical protein
MTCLACGTETPADARYCPHCGKSLTAGTGRAQALPWILAGASIAALAAVLLVRLSTQPAPAEPPAPMAGGQAPDISNMSPRERADRLFNRVMSAAERADTGEVKFFVPMALQSYTLIGPLDLDAHYHIGVIHLVNRNYSAALAQADSITRGAPRHLLATILRIEIASQRHDTGAQQRGYRDFLSAYDGEMAIDRTEYTHHRSILEHMRDEARRAVGPKNSGKGER